MATPACSAAARVDKWPFPSNSKGGRVVRAKYSRSFPGRIPHQIQIGGGSIASDFHAANTNVLDDIERVVPASA